MECNNHPHPEAADVVDWGTDSKSLEYSNEVIADRCLSNNTKNWKVHRVFFFPRFRCRNQSWTVFDFGLWFRHTRFRRRSAFFRAVERSSDAINEKENVNDFFVSWKLLAHTNKAPFWCCYFYDIKRFPFLRIHLAAPVRPPNKKIAVKENNRKFLT